MKKYSIQQCAIVLHELTHELAGEKLEQAIETFLNFLIKNKKISQAERIIGSYQLLNNEKNNRVSAVVATAHELSATDEKKIKERLMSLTGKEVIIESVLDASLLSGFKVTINDIVYNATTQKAVMNLQKQLSL